MRSGSRSSTVNMLLFVGVIVLHVWILSADISAEVLPTLTTRELVIRSETIVVGKLPVSLARSNESGRNKQEKAVEFKLLDVLKGSDVKVEDTLMVRGFSLYHLDLPMRSGSGRDEPNLPEVDQALLFLVKSGKTEAVPEFRLVISGLRCLTKRGRVLIPRQFENPGGYYFVPVMTLRWNSMIRRVRDDVVGVAEVMALKKIRDYTERNAAIFGWVELHRDEFRGRLSIGRDGEVAGGWGSLEPEVFNWIMESNIITDCWRAIETASSVGTFPERTHLSFCSVGGRKLLMDKIFDEKLTEKLRTQTLHILCGTFWRASSHEHPQHSMVSRAEQTQIIEQLITLLHQKNPNLRAAAVRAIRYASVPDAAKQYSMKTRLALPTLAELYKDYSAYAVHYEVVEAVRRIGNMTDWQEISGNGYSILVWLSAHVTRDEFVELGLHFDERHLRVREAPYFVMERLDNNYVVVERREVRAELVRPMDVFEKGWGGENRDVQMRFPVISLHPGMWRVTAYGVVAREKAQWHSEPAMFTISRGANENMSD